MVAIKGKLSEARFDGKFKGNKDRMDTRPDPEVSETRKRQLAEVDRIRQQQERAFATQEAMVRCPNCGRSLTLGDHYC